MSAHVTADSKAVVVKALLALAGQNGGRVPTSAVAAAARRFGVTERAVWKWLERRPARRAEPGLSRSHRAAIAAHHGNIAAAHRSLVAAGQTSLSYSAFWRQVQALPTDELAAITKGMTAAKAHQLYLQYEPSHSTAILHYDHTEVPIWVRLPRRNEPVKPWISLALWAKSRALAPPTITVGDGLKGDPNAETIVAIVAGAIRGFTTPDGVFVGGVPDVVVFDNALAHAADAVMNGFAHLGIAGMATEIASPWQNGKIERAIQTFEKRELSHLPGYTHRLEDRYGRTELPRETLLTLDEFSAEVEVAWERYMNTPHAGVGHRTPLQAWSDQGDEVTRVDNEMLRHAFLAGGKAIVQKAGVRHRGIDYTSPSLKGYVKREVSIGHLTNDRSFIEVYVDGRWLCTAVPHEQLTLEQRIALRKVKTSRLGQQDRIIKTSRSRARQDAEVELEHHDLVEAIRGEASTAPVRDDDLDRFLTLLGTESNA